MNEFEKQINALRLQFKAERVKITKDAYRTIGHLNNAISQSPFPEVREVLRAEKERTYEAMRNSHKYNRLCYIQQLEMLNDEYGFHLEKNPSKKQMRRMMAVICKSVEATGESSCTISFGENRRAEIIFS
ncbi:hypothetical protein [Muribaculum intestinale]|uniref:hypothetical protein n=1 Tax=Muribaculum intestinale TaxID=1796646 RepID=UPI00272C0873|nr:hypothetical protein [Muribaculum intestinale]